MHTRLRNNLSKTKNADKLVKEANMMHDAWMMRVTQLRSKQNFLVPHFRDLSTIQNSYQGENMYNYDSGSNDSKGRYHTSQPKTMTIIEREAKKNGSLPPIERMK